MVSFICVYEKLDFYVSNFNSSNVSVISGATNMVVATVPLPSGSYPIGGLPASAAVDVANGEVYVAEEANDNVCAIFGGTNKVVAAASVGSYPTTVAVDATNGDVYVTNSNSNNVSVIAIAPSEMYPITFAEAGLPSGTGWSVTLNGTQQDSTTSTVTFSEPNGTYTFTIGSVTGYAANPASGYVTVAGKPLTQEITFTAANSGTPSYTLLSDRFSSDTELNTSLWQIDSGILSNISSIERLAFSDNVISVPTSPPLGSLGLTSGGLQIGATGAYYLEGVTSQLGLVPPFSIEVTGVGGGSSTGNPLALFVSDASARDLVGVFASNSAYVQDGAQLPTAVLMYPGSPGYVAFFNATVSGYVVTLLNAGSRVVHTGTWTTPSVGAYYLTLADYAGSFPGEAGSPPFSDTGTYGDVQITSNQTWNLSITALGSGSDPDAGVQVSIANASGSSESATTGGGGVATFTNLDQGAYSIVGSQTQSGISVAASAVVQVGNPLQPIQSTVVTSLTIVAPPAPPLVVGINSVGGVSGYAPLVVTLDGVASGWTGSYTYQWQVGGQSVGTASALTYTYAAPGTYSVSLTATSQGTWFGKTLTAATETTTVEVVVLNTPFFTMMTPLEGYLNNYPFIKSTSYVTTEASTISGGAYLYLTPSGVYLNTNVTALNIAGYTIPSWLRAFPFGLTTPYYEIMLNDSVGTVDTGLLVQGASSQEINVALPPGAPTSVSALSGYHFSIRLNPYTSMAISTDAADIILSMIGLTSTLLRANYPAVLAQAAGFIGSTLSGIVDLSVAGGTTIISSIISALPAFQASLATFLTSLGLSSGILAAAQLDLQELAISYMMAKIGFGLGAVLGAMLSGGVREDFSVGSLQPMAQVSVSSSTQAPYVTVDPTTGTYGWSGAWENGSGPFVHSAFTNAGYSFAGLPGGSYTLTVEAPAGVSSTSYTISISQNGSDQSVAGNVQVGQPVVYHVQYSNGNLTVVRGTSGTPPTSGSGAPPWLTYLVGGIVVVGVAAVVLALLRRRGSGPSGPKMPPSQPDMGGPANPPLPL